MTTETKPAETTDVILRFNEAFNTHDADAIMALMTDDVVFDNTGPPPDGRRFEGQEAVRGVWEKLIASNPRYRFDTEDMFVSGDRCTVRWSYIFDTSDPDSGHVRGVDVFTVRDGKVAEKLSYVKG